MPSFLPSSSADISVQSSRASSVHSDSRRASEHHLHPQDAFYLHSPPRARVVGRSDTITQHHGSTSHLRSSREKRRGRSSSRRRAAQMPRTNGNGQWKKLLWVKQGYPDNYTDEETFLDHLQRNPRLRPYEFWPLVADSTIIVQHVCSVLIFVCCFTGIVQKRVSPHTVVGWATACTVLGWLGRDWWQTHGHGEEGRDADQHDGMNGDGEPADDNTSSGASADTDADFGMPFKEPLGTPITAATTHTHSRNASIASIGANGANSGISGTNSPILPPNGDQLPPPPPLPAFIPPYKPTNSPFSPRTQERLTTAKSAILIYCSLLGLSPILASLTSSTSSDSIWALAFWLLILNIFTFDYGAGPEVKFPASLSTNAALMASTVLASRLNSTTHAKSTTNAFSLTLFSMEVFGLFPVFRRHLRHYSWTGHVWLTIILVVLASAGLGMTISGGGWGFAVLGVVLGGLIMGLSMGMTTWWLIGLQRYKNEIHGPWDPARPIIRRQWQ